MNKNKKTKIILEIDLNLIFSKAFYPCADLRTPGDTVKIAYYTSQEEEEDEALFAMVN